MKRIANRTKKGGHQSSDTGPLVWGMSIGLFIAISGITWYFITKFGEEPVQRPTSRLLIFVDQSASISANQQTQWKVEGERLINQCSFGDVIAIFGLHDQTLNARAIYRGEIPALPEGAGLVETGEVKRALSQIKMAAKAELQQALQPGTRALHTDIFAALNRVRDFEEAERARHTVAPKYVVLFLSDMLHSTQSDLDMEKTRLAEDNLDDLLNPVIAKYRWQKGALARAEIHCVLNSIEIIGATPLNNRIILKKTWEKLFAFLGARLQTFETHITLNQ